MKNFADLDTVDLDDDKDALVIIDQTRLPNELKVLQLQNQKDIFEAIYLLKVRGAPAIGVAAAIGVYLATKQIKAGSFEDFYKQFKLSKDYLASSRPTAVNLFWALERMEKVVVNHKGLPIADIKEALRQEACTIKNEDIEICAKIGQNGLALLKDGMGILTHCNAGRLAAVRYGTALAPIYAAHQKGMKIKVYADETRPLLQGARLTAYELSKSGIDVTLICDNMAAQVMKNGWVDAVITGADRIAANGDVCNKIGTSGLAILAKHFGIPFYVAAPKSTFDLSLSNGTLIPIEQRPATEISTLHFKQPIAPEGVRVYNPSFDITPHSLIAGIITEDGVVGGKG
jgi:methylthioribose-1-phosphate isomerase